VALSSWQFLALAAGAAIAIPLSTGKVRLALFLAANATFAWSYWGPLAGVAVAFCLVGYVCARLVTGRGAFALAGAIAVITLTFAGLRGYSLDTLSSADAVSPRGALAFAGLSFLFFKIVHVVADAAAGSLGALAPGQYAAYCTSFTTLLMGPIQRYQDFTAQWTHGPSESLGLEPRIDAVNRVLRGLLKAYTIAPWVQPYVLRPGLDVAALPAADLLTRTVTFYVYLYLEFSGYCDIVIGAGTMLGVRPPENFAFPFLARNVSAYWLRVHRSLTLWLTDYVFTPSYRYVLGTATGERFPFLALAAALMLTMLVAGLWHGTTLNFLLFGLVHGVALVVARAYEHVLVGRVGRRRFKAFSESRTVTAVATGFTLAFTSLAYALFVLPATDAWRLYGRLASWVLNRSAR
jgi:D-alanyl-lipoteichoic acid acyltransferase DltB (MBOAT superfamily)